MDNVKSHQPRKSRKHRYNAPRHQVRKMLSVHLSHDLIAKYDLRSLPVRKGDTVKVIRGGSKGLSGKIAGVSLKKMKVSVEGATVQKADGKQIEKWIDPSNLSLTKLDLSDPWRKQVIQSYMEDKT